MLYKLEIVIRFASRGAGWMEPYRAVGCEEIRQPYGIRHNGPGLLVLDLGRGPELVVAL